MIDEKDMIKVWNETRNKTIEGAGRNLIYSFMPEASIAISNELFLYSKRSREEGYGDHAFQYGEDTMKGQIAIALAKLCDNFILQEPPVRRVLKNNDEDEIEEPRPCSGNADFWCRYGTGRKIDLLLEVKHSNALWKTNDIGLRKVTINKHNTAIQQTKNIDKSSYLNDHLYTAALTILVTFKKYESDNNEPYIPDHAQYKSCLDKIMTDCNCDYICAVKTPMEVNYLIPIVDGPTKSKFKSFPTLIFIWSVEKHSV